MSYPTQRGTLNRLELESRRAGRQLEDDFVGGMRGAWKHAKSTMRGVVMVEYAASHRGATWALRTAGPALERINGGISRVLHDFRINAGGLTRGAIRSSYRLEALRQLWMLDQLTPPSYRPKMPVRALREAAAEPASTWSEALEEWVRAYQATLATNLRLEALHAGSLTDAADEVDAAKVGGYDPAYKFGSMLTNQILATQRKARADVADENDELSAEEIFQTMEDYDVCPDCAPQDGKPVDEVEVQGHVYSFNCRCFERIVPRQWAELLRSGDADEREAALMADDRGLVSDAMVVRGADGGLVAHFTMPFEKWVQGRGAEISGLNLTGGAK